MQYMKYMHYIQGKEKWIGLSKKKKSGNKTKTIPRPMTFTIDTNYYSDFKKIVCIYIYEFKW